MNSHLLQRLEEIGAPDDVRALAADVVYQAVHDPLTGLYNRRYFGEALNQAIEFARRYDSPLSLVLFDLDHLKKINDTEGHEAGDVALRVFANVLKKTARSADIVCRIGGDEFVVILPETKRSNITFFVHRVMKSAAECYVKVSHGTASLPSKNLFAVADAELYAVKSKRKGME